jgi:hypothetical protein
MAADAETEEVILRLKVIAWLGVRGEPTDGTVEVLRRRMMEVRDRPTATATDTPVAEKAVAEKPTRWQCAKPTRRHTRASPDESHRVSCRGRCRLC